jgi:hypothetical protein
MTRARRTATVTAVAAQRDGQTSWRAARLVASAINVRLIAPSANKDAIGAHEHCRHQTPARTPNAPE